MVLKRKAVCVIFAAVSAAAVLLPGPCGSWAGTYRVKAGDEANVQFTCRLENGDIAASSYPSAAKDPGTHKSAVFVARAADTPIPVVAVEPDALEGAGKERGLEGEIIHRLSAAIVGMPVGERQTRKLRAGRLKEKNEGEYFIQIARVRQRPKEMSLTPGDYRRRTGKAPEVGQPFVFDPAVPGKVFSVSKSEVLIRFIAKTGDTVGTPFGEGTVKELPDRYEITIDAHQGDLVRSGGLVGRITSVDDRFIGIDYSRPFGGEELSCDVLVESVKRGTR